jgi:xylan 1,4-beta-xylosidase
MRLSFFIFLLVCIASAALTQVSAQNRGSERTIAINTANITGEFNRSYNFCVGAGRANEGLRADWQRQLRLAKQECDFRYIRFHGLLTDDMGVYKEDKAGNPHYNYQYIDELFDFLLSIKMKPFVELGFMPEALASGKKTVFWWKGNITPPKDYNKWDALIKNLVEHWQERYGKEEVKTWYFEVWNEPNLKGLFFSADIADYFKLYQETANTIKAVSPDYKVGGPATAGNAWIPQMISFCSTNKVPIDFISTHTYGVKQGFLDLTGDVGTIVSQSKNAVSSDMIRARAGIKESALPNLELHYTEWSSSYTPTDPIHDSYFEAAYILDKIHKAANYVNSMSYWTFTDIFEEQGPRLTPFHGGFGLINYQDIKKPAYYAYSFLNKLGNTELKSSDSSSIACKDNKGNMQLLFWNFTITHPGDSVNDQVFYKRDLPAKSIAPVAVKMDHIPAGKYKLQVYKVGYHINDAYGTYFGLKSPDQLTRQQVAMIRQGNSGKAISSELVNVTGNGNLMKSFPMRENDVYFVTIEKIKS